jgi:hypothetical protein
MRRRMLMLFLGLIIAFSPVGWTEFSAQPSQGQQQVTASVPEAGYLFFTGGFVRAKRARTQTAATQISAANAWVTIPGAILAYTVPVGTTDLFNVSFSAECTKILGGSARIRVMDTIGGGVALLEPYDGVQIFCSSASAATYTGTWVRRSGAGTHTLQVQILQTSGLTVIDDWTFELVVYD